VVLVDRTGLSSWFLVQVCRGWIVLGAEIEGERKEDYCENR
jgi:hypothetical protein